MKKKQKRKLNIGRVVLVSFLLILINYIIFVIICEIKFRNRKYEYYTRDGEHGISKECGVVMLGHESCLKGNYYIEVAQYTRLK